MTDKSRIREVECPKCEGKKKVKDRACPLCNGFGKVYAP